VSACEVFSLSTEMPFWSCALAGALLVCQDGLYKIPARWLRKVMNWGPECGRLLSKNRLDFGKRRAPAQASVFRRSGNILLWIEHTAP
jgi:hypothetical protein